MPHLLFSITTGIFSDDDAKMKKNKLVVQMISNMTKLSKTVSENAKLSWLEARHIWLKMYPVVRRFLIRKFVDVVVKSWLVLMNDVSLQMR